jgi:hypothetical protein
MRYAAVDQRGLKIFVYSKHKTVSGILLSVGGVRALDRADMEGIGLALRQAFSGYQTGVPDQRHSAVRGWPELFAAAGVRSWTEYGKGAKSLSAKLQDGLVTLNPWKNIGGRFRFEPLKGFDRTVPEKSPDRDLGAAVIAALGDAQ